MYLNIVSDIWAEESSKYWRESNFKSSEEAKCIIENFPPTMENAIRNSIMNLLGLSEKKHILQVTVHVTPVRHNYGSNIYNILITTDHIFIKEEKIEQIKYIIGNQCKRFATELFEVDENIEYRSGRRITQHY